MEKKYKLTEESITYNDKKLYRIEALKDFGNVRKGDKGGYVESEINLSHYDECWVYRNAKVYEGAIVCEDAKVFGNAEIYGDARVSEKSRVYGNAKVTDSSNVFDNAEIYGSAFIFNFSKVYESAKVYGLSIVDGGSRIFGNAELCGDAIVIGNADVCGDSILKSSSDYIVFKNWWSSGRHFTWTRSNNMWSVGCFYGTGKELVEKAYKDSELSCREYERVVNYVESILKDSEK